MDGLWQHSLGVASVARMIAVEERQGEDRPDQAFTAGMLHDIGLLLLASRQGSALQQCMEIAQAEKRCLWQVELDMLGATHADIGGYLLGLWGLPTRIVEAVTLHHTPGRIGYDGLCATTAVHVADFLARDMQPRVCAFVETAITAPDLAYLDRLGLMHRLEHWRKSAERILTQPAEACA